MDVIKMRQEFQMHRRVYDSALLKFSDVRGMDVYNCSIPFEWNGKKYIFGRVEQRDSFADSTSWLFEQVKENEYAPVPGSMIYPIEDPFIAIVHGEIIMGGTHVRKSAGKIEHYYDYFYRGKDPTWLTYFTCGPEDMKDIRLLELANGQIGVFSRLRNEQVKEKYGSGAAIGFAVINDINELTAEVVQNAKIIENLFGEGEWGGCNQCYLLKDKRIGIIGHRSYEQMTDNGINMLVYTNISFIYDPATHSASDMKIIGDKQSYPATECMRPDLADCAFTSGIVMRKDGKADLYSGLGDVTEGRITIDAPFGALL